MLSAEKFTGFELIGECFSASGFIELQIFMSYKLPKVELS